MAFMDLWSFNPNIHSPGIFESLRMTIPGTIQPTWPWHRSSKGPHMGLSAYSTIACPQKSCFVTPMTMVYEAYNIL